MLNYVLKAMEKGLSYHDGKIFGVSGKELKPRNGGVGYRVISIPTEKGKFINCYVHKLVYWFETKDVRVFDSEYEIHHKNHKRDDNRIDNLELMLAREHESRSSKGNLHNARITQKIADEIVYRYTNEKISQKKLAIEYELSQQHISDIVTGKKWNR